MDSYDECYKRICRICLSLSDENTMVSLTKQDGLSYYGHAIENFANVSIKLYEELPHNICQNCLVVLKQAIQFKLKCESSDKQLLYLHKQHRESHSNLKELVVDFSLFRDTFPNIASIPSSKEDIEYACEKIVKENIRITHHHDELSRSENKPDPVRNKSNDDILVDYFLDQLEKVVHDPMFLNSEHNVTANRQNNAKRWYMQNSLKSKQNSASKVPDNLVCEVCQKVLANRVTYKNHMQRHNGFDYICEHCAKGFPAPVELQMHLVTVHQIGPGLQCPHCSYKAPKKHVLTEHIRLHTGERPYACDKCGLTFRRKALWVKHKTYHKEKTIQCPNCPSKFHNIAGMKDHFNNIHERMYVYMCRECDTTYAKSTTLRKHLTEKHGIPREAQGRVLRVRKGNNVEFSEQ